MKVVKTTKILAAIYNEWLRDKIKIKNQLLVGALKTVNLTFNSREKGAYTTLEGKSKEKLRVVIGGGMVMSSAGLPDKFSDRATFKPYLNNIICSFYALDYHEMGHVCFTDMQDRSIIDYKDPKYIGFLHSLFNILEDPVVEANMDSRFRRDFPYDRRPKEFFDFLIKQIFEPQCEEYKDDGAQSGFMNYLLLTVRCGRAAIKGTCAVFDKYSENLLPLIKAVLIEPNPTERIHKTITLGEWIINNIKEFDWKMPEPSEHEKKSGSMAGSPGAPSPSSGSAMGGIPGESDGSPSGSSGKSDGADDKSSGKDSDTDDDVDSDKDDDKDDGKDDDKDEDTPGGPKTSPEDDVDVSDEVFDDVFNDTIHDGDDHEWVVAKDEYDFDDRIVDRINDQIERFGDCINDVTKFLKLFKGRVKPRELEGFTRGKLNLRRAMRDDIKNGCDTKIFNQSIRRGKDADLAVSLLCDNSGSMSGTKSEVCSRAALALAQACDWAGIPFECNCFTKTEDSMRGTCITITEKGFEDDFEKSKPFFAINDSTLIKYLSPSRYIPTFSGNSEEINLYYVWKKFARVNHKTKLLFVLCDGATTGSTADLKQIVRQIEAEDGIIVVGIGIMCSEVATIYPHSQLFHSQEDLETGLAQYLVDTLSKYAV